MLRRLSLFALIAALAAPLLAQTPAGWRVRIDRSQNAQDPDDRPDLKFMTAGSGLHIASGPAGTFWNPAHTAKGAFTVKGTFTLNKPSGHTNYYGLVFGGSELEGPNQTYIYFLVAQDGTYVIRQRAGDKVNDVQRSPHEAVRRPDSSGRSVNLLEVRATGDTIAYVVNGTTVHTTPRSGATARTEGLVGFRINHLLDVQVDGFELQQR